MFTRSSTRRLTQLNEEKVSASRKKRQESKSVIIISDSEEEDNIKYKNTDKRPPIIEIDDDCCTSPSPQATPRKTKSRTSLLDLRHDSPVTPPKMKKISDDVVATTPKHKNINENESHTPSTLFNKLALISPGKPAQENSNRKQLFTDEKLSPRKRNAFHSARKALHGAFPTEMPGREKELDDLRSFLKDNLQKKTSGSLYVSGPPGTGKTASLNMILQEDGISSEFIEVYVNCTAIKSSSSIYSRIAKELGVKINGKTEKDYLSGLEKYLRKPHKMILLVLDEIDQLESKNQTILYTIFEWPSRPNSQLILVGIANALDLTDRILPRLQARCELKPKLMHFAPYTRQQIVEIFTFRLKKAGVLEVFSPVALQMLAGKVAAVSGDVRRALDIGRRVIELVEHNKNKTDVLKPLENLAQELVDKEMETKPKVVDLNQVVNVLNNVYGTTQNLTEGNEDAFPLQQKIIICSLLLMLKKAKNKDVTIGKLHDVYRKVCTKRNILAVDQAEFVGLCSLIETRGIIKVSNKKEPRLHKVNLEWDEEEVTAVLKDKQLMSTILQDVTCLGKM